MSERMNLDRLPLPARDERWRVEGDRVVVESCAVNQLWLSRTTLVPATLEGEGFWERLHPEDRARLRQVVSRGGGQVFLRIRGKEDRWLPARVYIHAHRERDSEFQVLSLYAFENPEEMEQFLESSLHTDPLTGALNRATFLEVLDGYLAHRPEFLPVVVLDIHRFHEINATLGLEVGDQVLRGTVERLREVIPDQAPVGRLGPDEFGVLLTGVPYLPALLKVLDEMDRAFERPLANDEPLYVSFHTGVSIAPFDGGDAHNLVRRAELALASIKPMREKGVAFYSRRMEKNLLEDASLRSFLADAIQKEALDLHYQPILDLASGKVVGVEALLRWFHPYAGQVSPARFLPLAEKLGLMGALTRFVLRRSFRDLERLPSDIWVSVNLSPSQFHSRQIQALVESTLESSGADPGRLVVEITESTAMRDPLQTRSIFKTFKEWGIRIALDDFGTGYSSMSHLIDFDLDKIKLDRTFVTNLPENPKAFYVARTIIQLTHSLEATAVAEGIETREQLELLEEWGCDEGQGFLLARPMPVDDLVAFVKEHH